MFVKKLVEKASKKYGVAAANGLRAEDVNPRLTFHHGVPSGATSLAYDAVHNILAVAARDGRIKLFGRDSTQALLQSEEAAPTKFLQFFDDHGLLINVTVQNCIEVWDVEERQICSTHTFPEEITTLSVMQQSLYIYIGDALGNISILKVDSEQQHIIHMQYRIPYIESHGVTPDATVDSMVVFILPQPMAETKRVLIVFRDGVLPLWDISESKVIFTTGGSTYNPSYHESKQAVSACWACSYGSKVAVGYNNGEIFLWAVLAIADQNVLDGGNKKESFPSSNIPLLKLNLGYKTEKVPIVSLHYVAGDGRTSRLYVNGFSDAGTFHSFQVIILNENTESRLIKLVLPLNEACLGMELISCYNDKSKHKNVLVLLLRSGHLCLFDDSEIEHWLLQCQSKSPLSLPKPIRVRLRNVDSIITVAKFYTGNSFSLSPNDEDHMGLANKYSNLLSIDMKEKDANQLSSIRSRGFSKTKNLYITGHHDGVINFWEASCPLLLPILSIKPQVEAVNSSTGVPVAALAFDASSQVLVSGDSSGLACIIIFKKEQYASENIFSFMQGKQGINYTIRCVKLNGVIQSISINSEFKHIAVGTSKGYVSVVHMDGATILYQKHFSGQDYMGINSLHFEKYDENGHGRNMLLVGVEDSSVLALEADTGNALITGIIHTKTPCKALLTQMLEISDSSSLPDSFSPGKQSSAKDIKSKQSLILVCSEKAVRLYFLNYAMQGFKKMYGKKKLSGKCCYASTFWSPPFGVGLLLIFVNGKIELRSLPDLALLKETSLRGFTFSSLKSNPSGVFSASAEGEVIMVNGDQEIIFLSVLLRHDVYRHVEDLLQVCNKDVGTLQERLDSGISSKEKKKGIFSMIVKDTKGNKSKHSQETDASNSAYSSEELLGIFSTVNFPPDIRSNDCCSGKNEDVELSIDDIDLDDTKEKTKGKNFVGINKQKLGKTLQAIKGKLKPKADDKMDTTKEVHEDDKIVGAIDLIKKKYGYSTNNDSSNPRIAASKLRENVSKLQSIGTRTSEMEGTAQSFATMAKELLRSAQHNRSS